MFFFLLRVGSTYIYIFFLHFRDIMSLKFNSVVDFLTNPRLNWLTVDFFPNFLGRAGKAKNEFS